MCLHILIQDIFISSFTAVDCCHVFEEMSVLALCEFLGGEIDIDGRSVHEPISKNGIVARLDESRQFVHVEKCLVHAECGESVSIL